MLMHCPVLLQEMLSFLRPQAEETYVDATFGGGGYTQAILAAAPCVVHAIDRDPAAVLRAQSIKEKYGDRFNFYEGCFSDLEHFLPLKGGYNGIVFDFGVSSFQLDEAERGFSFRHEGPLDMRMTHGAGITAGDVVNTFSESQLADIFYFYGEERKAKSIARAIVEKRKEKPFQTTVELAELVRRFVYRKDGLDPATLTFQALRIFVNNELMEIDKVLGKSLAMVAGGARIVAVTFHSLEDRLVKNWVREQGQHLHNLTRKVVVPSDGETRSNPRARSAKLRAVCVHKEETL